MELLEEKQFLHFFFLRLGGQMFHVPHCAHLSGLQVAIVALRLLVCYRHRVWWMTSGFAYHSALCCYTQSHTPFTQHLQTPRTALWSDVCRGRFRTIFKVMTRPLCFHGCHFSSVAPWRSLSSKKALSRLTDTSSSCLQSASFLPLLSRNVEFLYFIWRWLESISSAHLPVALPPLRWEQRHCLGKAWVFLCTRMTWPHQSKLDLRNRGRDAFHVGLLQRRHTHTLSLRRRYSYMWVHRSTQV